MLWFKKKKIKQSLYIKSKQLNKTYNDKGCLYSYLEASRGIEFLIDLIHNNSENKDREISIEVISTKNTLTHLILTGTKENIEKLIVDFVTTKHCNKYFDISKEEISYW